MFNHTSVSKNQNSLLQGLLQEYNMLMREFKFIITFNNIIAFRNMR